MQVFEKKSALKHCLSLFKKKKKLIGFVPTMGALHDGHLSLIANSIKNNDITVVSIFINPTQFNNKEDLEKYPKTLKKDLALLKGIDCACDIVFVPTIKEIYADDVISKTYSFDGLESQMEGQFRAGHFDGVATIVHTFFEIVKPDTAYFGEKDFQQLQIIKKMVQKNNLPVQVIGCPIFREEDGLAMSSRNTRLTEKQRAAAPFIFQTLNVIRAKTATKSIDELTSFVKTEFEKHPVLDLEYFTIAEESTLLTPEKRDSTKTYRAFIAVHAGEIRLIDNISLSEN